MENAHIYQFYWHISENIGKGRVVDDESYVTFFLVIWNRVKNSIQELDWNSEILNLKKLNSITGSFSPIKNDLMIIITVLTYNKIRQNEDARDWLCHNYCYFYSCVRRLIRRLRLGDSADSLVPSSPISCSVDTCPERMLSLFSS